MEVAAHNIANAATDGYSRQRVTFTGNPTVRTVQGVFGSGVHISTVGHVRDELLDRAFYRGLGTATESEARASVLGRIEGLFGEPSETGLGAAMDQFYSGWSSLASNPNSTVSRSALRQQATALIEKFHSLVANIDQVRQDVETRLTVTVDRVTALSADIARLNTAIVAAESDGKTAGDLRDTRGRALAELAGLIPEFYEDLSSVAPAMRDRTIFMTGGFLDSSTEDFIEGTGRPSIKKPFDLVEMARTVEG